MGGKRPWPVDRSRGFSNQGMEEPGIQRVDCLDRSGNITGYTKTELVNLCGIANAQEN